MQRLKNLLEVTNVVSMPQLTINVNFSMYIGITSSCHTPHLKTDTVVNVQCYVKEGTRAVGPQAGLVNAVLIV